MKNIITLFLAGDELRNRIECINPLAILEAQDCGLDTTNISDENIFDYGIVFVEGIGNIGQGILYELGGNAGLWSEWGVRTEFNNLYDHEENIIFPGKGIQAPDSGHINNIEVNTLIINQLYDLHGHKVDSPQRGSIYIHDGKKVVWE